MMGEPTLDGWVFPSFLKYVVKITIYYCVFLPDLIKISK